MNLFNDSCKWTTSSAEAVNFFFNIRVFLDGWSVVRLEPGINDKWPCTAPMLLMNHLSDTMNINCRIRSGECDPQKIFQSCCSECTVVCNYNKRPFQQVILLIDRTSKLLYILSPMSQPCCVPNRILICRMQRRSWFDRWAGNSKYAGYACKRFREMLRKVNVSRDFVWQFTD